MQTDAWKFSASLTPGFLDRNPAEQIHQSRETLRDRSFVFRKYGVTAAMASNSNIQRYRRRAQNRTADIVALHAANTSFPIPVDQDLEPDRHLFKHPAQGCLTARDLLAPLRDRTILSPFFRADNRIMPDALIMTSSRYSKTAMALHWSLALALVFQIGLGWQFETLNRGPNLFALYQLHKSVGIAILVLSLARLAIRIWRPRPMPLADTLWSRYMANLVHGAFYVVLIGGPLTGWLLVSSSKIAVPTVLFGILPFPHLPVGHAVHAPAEVIHAQLAWLTIALLLLHVVGAVRHQFFKDEDILQRMLPWLLKQRSNSAVAIAAALAALGIAYAAGASLVLTNTKPSTPPKLQSPAPATAAPAIAPPKGEETSKTADEQDIATPVKKWRVSQGGRLAFTADWNGTPINGTFRRWSSDIRFSPDDLAQSRVGVTIDLGSASTADSQRDEMLLGEGFLDVATHPKAVFSSSEIKLVRGDAYRARGTLSLHGETHPVTLDFTLKIDGTTAKVSGSSSLRRTQFGVGSGEWAATTEVADAVTIAFNFSAQSAP